MSEQSSQQESVEAEPEIHRESMDVDVLFVGAGAASLAGAIRLMQCIQAHNESGEGDPIQDPTIAIVEKGSEVGAHILSGAVLNPQALDELLPDWREQAPIGPEVDDEDVTFLTENGGFNLPIVPPPMHNKGKVIVSASRLARWLASKAEEMGVMIFPGFPAVDVLWDGDRVVGVQTGDKGIDHHGKRKANFEPGILLKAKVTIFGEGVLGHCTRLVTKKLNLDQGCNPWQFETGVKEIIKLPEGKGVPGYVMHTLGWPFDTKTHGGTWIYGMDDDYLSIGLVVSLDYKDPGIDPQYMLQQFKSHPKVAKLIEGGVVEEYGGKALSAGGWYAMQQTYFDGGMFIGESAHIMNIAALKGMHLAMKSGMLAAETAVEALAAGDYSADQLKAYKDRIDDSYIKKEMWACRNFHQSFDKGLWVGMMRTGPAMLFGSIGRRNGHTDHDALQTVAVATGGDSELSARPKVEIPSFKPKLDDLYLSGTGHEEDQPSHLLVADPEVCRERCTEEFGNPCTRFCPAEVYEMVEDEERGGSKLQVNFSNCVHCKTCDIKDPYQIITWVPPEGGGGPNYKMA